MDVFSRVFSDSGACARAETSAKGMGIGQVRTPMAVKYREKGVTGIIEFEHGRVRILHA